MIRENVAQRDPSTRGRGGPHETLERARSETRVILLVSTDLFLHRNLRGLANELGQLVVKTEQAVGFLAALQAVKPAAVLLDLDLPKEEAWKTAALLLQQQACPPVILLTSQAIEVDPHTAIPAGALVAKSEGAPRILQAVDESLGDPGINQEMLNALQHLLLRWFQPSGWERKTAPAYRFWGINE